MNSYKYFEKKIISNLNRFKLNKGDLLELKSSFNNSTILITGGCGSIGSTFVDKIYNFNFKKLYILDKNENELTELNRELASKKNKKKLLNIEYICADITSIDINKLIIQKKINHYLNFAAIKHVRSEEQFESIKYMLSTNTICFVPSSGKYLKKFFSVSSDKSVNPKSILGVSKFLMEKTMVDFKINNKNVFVSTARFANVSFSNGSILKYAQDKIYSKQIFGVPKYIKRYFITHEEACDLCFKSLLNRNNGFVIIPNKKILKNSIIISGLIDKLVRLNGYKTLFLKKIPKIIKINKIFPILLTEGNTHGQKKEEEFFNSDEVLLDDIKDSSVNKIEMNLFSNTSKILSRINKLKTKNKLISYLKKNIKYYKTVQKPFHLSKTI